MPNEVAECCRMFEEIERERLELVRELGEWPVERQNFRPAEGAWSAVELVDHVVRVESLTIGDMREGLRRPRVLGEGDRPKIAELERALRSEKRFRVPAGQGGIYPEAQTTWAEVTERWKESRVELRGVVERMGPDEARWGVFEHPFAGWMTVEEVLKHFSDHLYHHQFQLARLRMSWAERMEQE
jgi:uncharacterized damage-inducible protein DinB